MCVREKQKGCSLTFSNRKKEFTSSSSPLPIHPSSPMSPMAKSRPPKRILESYTIKGSDRVIKPGDSVLMKAFDSSKPPYVARVEAIEAAGSRGTNVRGRVRWYYRPEESIGGRRPFHGAKEVFLSDHYDVQSADTIEGKCNVYSFRDYTKLDAVNAEDYFCRFEYKSATGSFVPDHIAVFCKCEMPYNPDDLMIQCEECSDWFHPSCLGMSIKVAKKLEHFFCESCGAENGKKIENSHEATRQSEEKARKIGMLLPAATRIRRPRAASAEDKVTSAARVKRGHGEGGGSGGGDVRRQLVESKRRRR